MTVQEAQVDDLHELDDEDFVDELTPGTQLLHGQYTIESFLNSGGFGITYLARDSLDRSAHPRPRRRVGRVSRDGPCECAERAAH